MVRFGPSGNCDLFYALGHKDSEEAPKWLNEMGLTAYEYGFTLGRFLTPEKSKKLFYEAKKYNIKISVHAPYYINFCNTSSISIENNTKYVSDKYFSSVKSMAFLSDWKSNEIQNFSLKSLD